VNQVARLFEQELVTNLQEIQMTQVD